MKHPEFGNAPLTLAAGHDHVDTIRALLRFGADAEARGNDDETALSRAVRRGCGEAVQALLDGGAQASAQGDERRPRGTPLMLAVTNGHAAIAQNLIAHGAEPNVMLNSGLTALRIAVIQGHKPVVSALLASGANPELRADGELTPLMLAARKGHAGCIQALIDGGAEVDALFSGQIDNEDYEDWTALYFARDWGHRDAADILAARPLRRLKTE